MARLCLRGGVRLRPTSKPQLSIACAVVTPARKFTVVRHAAKPARPAAKSTPVAPTAPAEPAGRSAHAMQQAFIEAAQQVAAVLAGASLSANAERSASLSAELRRDVHDLVYGTLRCYGEGDALLKRLVDRDPDPLMRALILIAIYRLAARPDSEYVVVDQAVDAAGVLTQRKAGGFVNAVLRNFLRRRVALRQEIAAEPEVMHRHPQWWARRLEAAWPDQWRSVIAANNAAPPLSLRVNVLRTTRDAVLEKLQQAGVAALAVVGFPSAVRLPDGTRIDTLPGYADGDFAVQDPGAQRAAEWLDVANDHRVLDACAAPGGKAGHLLELADIDLLALDIDALRCQRIEDNLLRLGLRAKVVVGDAGHPDDWWDGQLFDRILADVPCTASGVVRRHPDVKWLRRDEDIRKFARTQAALLSALWPLLKPGGKLLYATCSVFPEENDLQISAFNAAFAEAKLLKLEQLLPNQHHDGFFYALLEKPLA